MAGEEECGGDMTGDGECGGDMAGEGSVGKMWETYLVRGSEGET